MKLVYIVLLVGCGALTVPVVSTEPDGGEHDAGVSVDAGSMADAGAMVDAGASPCEQISAAPSTPAQIGCGDTSCASGESAVCCLGEPSGAADHGQCVSRVCSGARIECDEAADCSAGMQCCFQFTYWANRRGTSSTCQTTCSLGAYTQLCRTSDECPAGKTCQTWSANGLVLSMCEKPIGC